MLPQQSAQSKVHSQRQTIATAAARVPTDYNYSALSGIHLFGMRGQAEESRVQALSAQKVVVGQERQSKGERHNVAAAAASAARSAYQSGQALGQVEAV